MVSLHRGGRSRFILALLLLTAVTLATLDARGFGPVESARGLAATVLSPFRSAADWVTSPVRSGWNGLWGYQDLEEENARLQAELDEIRGQEFREATAEEVLAQMFTQGDLTFAGDLDQVQGRVVAGPTSNFEETVTIDRGSDHGISVGMVAVTGAGLVGRVASVTGDRAVIQLITDARSVVGVRLASTGDRGIVEGRGRNRSPELVVTGSVELTDGERLITSGLERSLFPPDIPVGRIISVPVDDESGGDAETTEPSESTTTTVDGGVTAPELGSVPSREVEVDLLADLDSLTFITILLWEPGT